ncbi:MAG: alpha-glucuronidase [Cytophagales bacterium]|nr:alpha-glucuronidase [Cytophagales bacterium]
MKRVLLFLFLISCSSVFADDGSRLWLKYDLIKDEVYRKSLVKSYNQIVIQFESDKAKLAAKEIQIAFKGLTGKELQINLASKPELGGFNSIKKGILLTIGTDKSEKESEGFRIQSQKGSSLIIGKSEQGLIYGAFAFIRLIQMQGTLDFTINENPKIQVRMLNHWDNANGTVERGYAGSSIWKWFELPYRIDPRYIDYARANASIGINAASINNVNASSRFLTAEYLEKIKAVADVLRPYGIKVFISVNFRSPRTLGGLETSDPLDPGVRKWWKDKTDEIHQYIPDFGGYLVKANSEGEPGPQDYGRTHADGANMLADAMGDHEGIVIWRAFVYDADPDGDRFREAYDQFKPLDGTFDKKVIVQVKNGPIDFMPREPFHPMFGSFPETPLAMEFQITQEYLGHSTHLNYLAPMFKECLDSDTYAEGKGSTVAKVIDGSVHGYPITVMAGVANTGSDANWTGHPFGQANWYAFGRLAWDHTLSSEKIANEWVKQTLTNDSEASQKIVGLMMNSLPAYINYTYPLGLHHMMGEGHHYGPQPWLEKSGRPDWTSVYYHRAAKDGIGFDRNGGISNSLKLYAPEVIDSWGNPDKMDLNYLFWFHHLSWDYKLSTGKTVWDELMSRYYSGPEEVKEFQKTWDSLKSEIDIETYENVKGRLAIQYKESLWWRDACYLYFKQYSGMPLPNSLKEPERTLQDVIELEQIYHLR